MSVKDWSTTAASNTSVDGVSIAENAPFANMNDSQRAIMANVKLEVASFGTVVTAASAPDIAIDGQVHTVNGTTSIAGFATAPAGLLRILHFETATPLVNGSSLALPGSNSFTTAKGDVGAFRSLGSGNWKCEYFSRNVASATAGKHKLWVPAAAMLPNPAGGPSSGQTVGSDVVYYTLDFDNTSNEIAQFCISMPSSWDEGTVTFRPVWTAASGSGGVVWQVFGLSRGDDDALSGSVGTGQTSTDTLLTAGDLHRGPESSAITISDSPAANDTVFFLVLRLPGNASDTLGVDAKLIGIELYFTTNESVDVAT